MAKNNPYPFKIPKFIPPKNIDLNKIHPELRFEFLRVEALLRSPKIHKLFKLKDKQKALACLTSKYGLIWNIIDGAHHSCLGSEAVKSMDSFIKPVKDIGAMISRNKTTRETMAEVWIKGLLSGESQKNDSYLTIQIDTRYSPTTILDDLKPILKEKCEKTKKRYKSSHLSNIRITNAEDSSEIWGFTPLSDGGPTDPIKQRDPDILTWLQYFRWYDLSHCTGLTHDQITLAEFNIFDSYVTKGLSRVSKGIMRAKNMIKAAESCKWPPANSS